MNSKLSKKQMINDINIFFLKQGKVCEGNIYKISKAKLFQIIIENDIPHINNDNLKKEIEETEKFNYYIEIIHHNFMKYKNIPFNIIRDIHNNNNLEANDLENIIKEYNLKCENDVKDLKELVMGITDLIKKYHNSKIPYKTIPDIIEELSLISNYNCN